MLEAGHRVAVGIEPSQLIRGLGVKKSSFFSSSTTIPKCSVPQQIISCHSHPKNTVVYSSSKFIQASSRRRWPSLKLIAKVTIRRTRYQALHERVVDQIDCLSDLAGQKILLQIVSTEVDPKTGLGKRSHEAALQDWANKASIKADKVQYVAEFTLPRDFGLPGAITVLNSHQSEFYVETIALHGLPNETIYFPCYSWVHPVSKNPEKRLFFSNQTYLPSQTPNGLKYLREKEMLSLRGNGKGIRKPWERVYDYAPYNDLGNPDRNKDLARPTLGGNKLPYPRRCRTGRLHTKTDPSAESFFEMGTDYYVPRDEAFEQVKKETFLTNALKGMIRQMVPSLLSNLREPKGEFHCLGDIDRLYEEQVVSVLGNFSMTKFLKGLPIPEAFKHLQNSLDDTTGLLQFPEPDILSKDKLAWLRDDEFGRQVLAGANPIQIERMQIFPPKSNLDPKLFGSVESAIKAEHLEGQLEGLSIQQAVDEGRLFLLDYHDVFLPFLNKINALNGRKMYASRTVLFLTSSKTLTPVAIELSLSGENTRVFTPGQDASTSWLWQLAKVHVSSNDAGFHQLVNHWLRSHATAEPYVIATYRQLSCMHPIFKLLKPHFRYTLEINASARQNLINADGIIENSFTPGPYALEISSAAYGALWRFDQESLPADLIRRGMALEDKSMPEGLRLVIEDYPYATDGLLIWSAIKEWVTEYVNLYYTEDQSVISDSEVQQWWKEIKDVGHADKKDEAWWPDLKTRENLQAVLTTMIWIVSGFHAAVNFGQYAYTGYVPNRPCMTRRLIPVEGSPEYKEFLENPEKFFLSTISNQLQATTTMAVVDTLSTHSPDEEYLGHRPHANWTADPNAMALSHRFSHSIQLIEQEMKRRNMDPNLRNRNAAGVIPYELLMPSSGPGRTGRGVPNSISI